MNKLLTIIITCVLVFSIKIAHAYELKKYENKDFFFSLKYPSSWTIKDTTTKHKTFTQFISTDKQNSFYVLAIKLDDGKGTFDMNKLADHANMFLKISLGEEIDETKKTGYFHFGQDYILKNYDKNENGYYTQIYSTKEWNYGYLLVINKKTNDFISYGDIINSFESDVPFSVKFSSGLTNFISGMIVFLPMLFIGILFYLIFSSIKILRKLKLESKYFVIPEQKKNKVIKKYRNRIALSVPTIIILFGAIIWLFGTKDILWYLAAAIAGSFGYIFVYSNPLEDLASDLGGDAIALVAGEKAGDVARDGISELFDL